MAGAGLDCCGTPELAKLDCSTAGGALCVGAPYWFQVMVFWPIRMLPFEEDTVVCAPGVSGSPCTDRAVASSTKPQSPF